MGRIKDEYDIPFGSNDKNFSEKVEEYKLKEQYKQVLETRKRTAQAIGSLEEEIEKNKEKVLPLPKGTVLAVGNGSMENVIDGKLPIGREEAIAKDNGIVEGSKCSYQLLEDGSVWTGAGGKNWNTDNYALIHNQEAESSFSGNILSITQRANNDFCYALLNRNMYTDGKWYRIKWEVIEGAEYFEHVLYIGQVFGGTAHHFSGEHSGELEYLCTNAQASNEQIQIAMKPNNSGKTLRIKIMLEESDSEKGFSNPFCITSSPTYQMAFSEKITTETLFIQKFYGKYKPTALNKNAVIVCDYNTQGGLGIFADKVQNQMNDKWNKIVFYKQKIYLNGYDVTFASSSNLLPSHTIKNFYLNTYSKGLGSVTYQHSSNVNVKYSIFSNVNITEEEARNYSLYDVDFPQNGEKYPVGRSLVKRTNNGGISGISQSVTYSVGKGGDYLTINEALRDLSRKKIEYVMCGINVNLKLLTGYVMKEQIILKDIDLSWITIWGDDSKTDVQRSALTTGIKWRGEDTYPVFYGLNSNLPKLHQLFSVDETTHPYNNNTVYAILLDSSELFVYPSSGMINGAINLVADKSRVSARASIWDSAYYAECVFASSGSIIGMENSYARNKKGLTNVPAVYAVDASRINISGGDVSGSVGHGIRAHDCSTVEASSIKANSCGVRAIYASMGSRINAGSGNVDNSGTDGVYADGASTINFDNGSALSCGNAGIFALNASTINAQNSQVNGSISGILSYYGSNINADAGRATSTGSLSLQAYNNSRISFEQGTASSTGSRCIHAYRNSNIMAYNSDLTCSSTGNGTRTIYAQHSSTINIDNCTITNTNTTSNDTICVLVERASTITANSSNAVGGYYSFFIAGASNADLANATASGQTSWQLLCRGGANVESRGTTLTTDNTSFNVPFSSNGIVWR